MQSPKCQKQGRQGEERQRCQVQFANAAREIGTGLRLDSSTCGPRLSDIFVQMPGYFSFRTIPRVRQVFVAGPGAEPNARSAKE